MSGFLKGRLSIFCFSSDTGNNGGAKDRGTPYYSPAVAEVPAPEPPPMEVPKHAEGQQAIPKVQEGWVDNFYSREFCPQAPTEPLSPTIQDIFEVDEVRVQTRG